MSEDGQDRLEAKHQGHEMSPELANVVFSCLSSIFLNSVKTDGYLLGLRERGITPTAFDRTTVSFSSMLKRPKNDDLTESSHFDVSRDTSRRYSLEVNFKYNGGSDFEPLDFILAVSKVGESGTDKSDILRAKIEKNGARAVIYDGRSEEEVVLELLDTEEDMMNTDFRK